jgi:hypothetical protein
MTFVSAGKIQVGIAPADRTLPFGNQFTVEADTGGRAVVPEVPWGAHRVSVTPLQPDLYVQTIRYYGNALSGPVFESVAGGTLEIDLEDHAPTLTGSVMTDRPSVSVFLVRWPMINEVVPGSGPPFQYVQRVESGAYSMRLAPGEYRAIAISDARMRAISSAELRDLLVAGERVVLERGEEKTLDLKSVAR